jgi:hypothetical protein
MAVINSPFESQYGFRAPGFSVDELGNIIAASISTDVATASEVVNFVVNEASDQFSIETYDGPNPTITVARASVYRFALNVPELKFTIYQADQETLYNTGLTHSDRSTGAAAQGKDSGTLAFSVSASTPNLLYYSDATQTNFGIINVVDPAGSFSSVSVNENTAATSSTTGAMTIAGGVGIEGDVFIGGSLNIDGVGITSIRSTTNLELEATNNIIVKIDGSTLGVATSAGMSIPVINTSINNTVIGAVTPAAAAFTSATVVNAPIVDSSVTNKQYVDSQALSLSIAFGL